MGGVLVLLGWGFAFCTAWMVTLVLELKILFAVVLQFLPSSFCSGSKGDIL
jgi:hypothetical protein